MNTEILHARRATIARAVAHLRHSSYPMVRRQLLDAALWSHWQRNPSALADHLSRCAGDPDDVGRFFGAWKGAQRVLLAAGLPWHPDHYRPTTDLEHVHELEQP
jgi:hypothetical protein